MNFLKHHILVIIIAIAASAGIIYYAAWSISRNRPLSGDLATKMALSEEINVVGKTQAAENLDLAFELAGKVVGVYADVGDKVNSGQKLASLDLSDLNAKLAKAEADLEQINPDFVAQKNNASLQSLYASALIGAQQSASDGKDALLTLTDIQYAHFMGSGDQDSINISGAKSAAVQNLLGASGSGQWSRDSISPLSGGVLSTLQNAALNQTSENIDAALSQTLSALQLVKMALDSIPDKTSFTATEAANLSAARHTVAADISAVSGNIQGISIQKIANDNSSASNAAQIKSAKANIENIRVQIAKTDLLSPIYGVVTKQGAKVGEIVSPGAPVVSLISRAKFEIAADVSEADVAKIKTGNPAKVTLDAYGSGVVFDAHVAKIDPDETILNGVASYGVTLQFENDDERIKPGMTANVNIIAAIRENALAVPASAIITRGDEKFVLVDTGNAPLEERKVEIGITGSNGYVEILSGLKERERVAVFGKSQ